jgi:hypothetical protein
MRHKFQIVALILLTAFSIVGCSDDSGAASAGGNTLTKCEEPRPEICTSIYDPVCGTLTDDTQRTFASACTACSVEEVDSYVQGACK